MQAVSCGLTRASRGRLKLRKPGCSYHCVGARRPIATRRPLFAIEFPISPGRKWRILVDRVGAAPDKQIDVLRIGDINIRRFGHCCEALCTFREKLYKSAIYHALQKTFSTIRRRRSWAETLLRCAAGVHSVLIFISRSPSAGPEPARPGTQRPSLTSSG